MDSVSLGFLFAICAVGLLSALTMRPHATILSFLLLCSWGATKIVALYAGWTVAHLLYPFSHLVMIGVVMALWWERPRPWKLGMVFALLTSLFIDFGYWAISERTRENLWNYVLALNILFAIEIMCVSIAGGEVVGRAVGNRLSSHRARHRHVVPASGRSTPHPKGR
jgi:hypothetical protein